MALAAKHVPSTEVEIRALLDGWAEAIRAKDINRRMSNYAQDVVFFDFVGALRYVGSDAVKACAEWFSSLGDAGFEHRDVSIAAGDDVAFCHSLYRVHRGEGRRKQNRHVVARDRVPAQVGGKWIVTDEHQSVPFNMESGRRSLDLKP